MIFGFMGFFIAAVKGKNYQHYVAGLSYPIPSISSTPMVTCSINIRRGKFECPECWRDKRGSTVWRRRKRTRGGKLLSTCQSGAGSPLLLHLWSFQVYTWSTARVSAQVWQACPAPRCPLCLLLGLRKFLLELAASGRLPRWRWRPASAWSHGNSMLTKLQSIWGRMERRLTGQKYLSFSCYTSSLFA